MGKSVDKATESTTLENSQATTPPSALSEWIAYGEWWFIAWMLYCLSIGPMYHLWYIGKFTQTSYFWVAAFYEPLWQLARLIPPLGWWLDGYCAWWVLG